MSSKKERVDLGRLDFDSELDFNFDDPFQTARDSGRSKKRAVVEDVFKGAVSGAKSRMKTGSFWNMVAKKALPSTYETIVDGADAAKASLGSLYNQSARELKPQMSRIARQIDAMVPAEQQGIKRMIRRFIPNNNEQAATNVEALRNQAIEQMNSDVFSKLGIQQQARRQVEQKLDKAVEQKRFSATIGVMGSINENLANIKSYQLNVDAAYKRKSLELQYRSYSVQAESLRLTDKYFQLFTKQHEAIIKNTALPEFVKLTNSERFAEMARSKLMDKLQTSLFSAGLRRLQERGMDYVRGLQMSMENASMGLDGIGMAVDMHRTMREAGMGQSNSEMLGEEAGKVGLNLAGSKLGQKLGKILPKNGRVRRGLGATASAINNPGGFVRGVRENERFQNARNAGGLKGRATGLLDGLMEFWAEQEDDKGISKGRAAGALTPSIFDSRAHKSLTEAIPGLLSRILQETKAIRTGSVGPLEVYDYQRGRFTTKKDIVSRAATEMRGTTAAKDVNYNLDTMLDHLTGYQSIDDDARVRLKRYLFDVSRRKNDVYTPSNLKNMREIEQLSASDRKIIESAYDRFSGSSHEDLAGLSKIMTASKVSTSNATVQARQVLENYIREGYGEYLHEEGIITDNSDGGYDIDMAAYVRFLREEGVTSRGQAPDKPVNFSSFRGVSKEEFDRRRSGPKRNAPLDPKFKKSDINAKSSRVPLDNQKLLNAIGKVGGYRYQYKKGSGFEDGMTHYGYMAQDINKNLGNTAAPNGTAVDRDFMSAINTHSINALRQEQLKTMKDPTSVDVLKSIHKDTSEMVKLLKEGGIATGTGSGPGVGGGGASSGLINWNLARKMGSRAWARLSKGGQRAGGMAASGLGMARDGVGSLWGAAKGSYDKNKDPVVDGAKKAFASLLDGISQAYGQAKEWAATNVPKGIATAQGALKKAGEGVRNWLNQPRDFYIPGLKSPVIIGDLLRRGYYVDADGKPVTTIEALKNLKSDLYKRSGEVAVSLEQMGQGLIDRHGEKLSNMISSIKGAAGAIAGKIISHGRDNLLRAGAWLGEKMKGVKSSLSNTKWPTIGLGTGKVENLLEEIRDILRTRLGGYSGPSAEAGHPSDTPQYGGTHYATPNYMGASGANLKNMGRTAYAATKGAGQWFKNSSMTAGARNRLGKVGSRLGGLGGGFLGRLGGKVAGVGGAAFSALSGLFSKSADQPATQAQPEQMGPPAPSFAQRSSNIFADAKARIAHRIAPGAAAYNDKDGSGKRDGSWQDRLDEQSERDRLRRESMQGQAGESAPRYQGGGALGLLGTFLKTLAGGVGSFITKAAGILGPLGGIVGGLGGLLGKGAGALARGGVGAAGGLLSGAAGLAGRGAIGALGKGAGLLTGVAGAAGNLIKGAAAGTIVSRLGGAAVGAVTRAAGMAAIGSIGASGAMSGALSVAAAGLSGLASVLASPVVLGAAALAAVGYGGYKLYQYVKNRLNDYERIRVMQYGFPDIGNEDGGKVIGLENYLLDGRLMFPGKVAQVNPRRINPEEMLSLFGIDKENKEMVSSFTTWFTKRFKPFFLNSVTALYGLDPKMKLSNVSSAKPLVRKNYLTAARFDSGPYDVTDSPFSDTPASDTQEAVGQSTDKLLAKIKDEADASLKVDPKTGQYRLENTNANDRADSKTALARQQERQKKDDANSQTYQADQSAKRDKNFGTGVGTGVKEISEVRRVDNALANATSSNDSNFKQDINPTFQRRSTASVSNTPSGSDSRDYGRVAQPLLSTPGAREAGLGVNPTAGKADPFATDREGVKNSINEYSKLVGVDGKMMQVVAAVESGLNPQAKASTSSAEGPFQFIKSTWTSEMKQHKARYGLDGTESPTNLKAATVLAGEYMRSNEAAIKKVRPNPTIVDLYMAHFLGAGGARTFLGANPNTIAAEILPAPAKANPTIFYDKGRPRTVDEIYGLMGKKLAKAAKSYGITGVDIPTSMGGKPKDATAPTGTGTGIGVGASAAPSGSPGAATSTASGTDASKPASPSMAAGSPMQTSGPSGEGPAAPAAPSTSGRPARGPVSADFSGVASQRAEDSAPVRGDNGLRELSASTSASLAVQREQLIKLNEMAEYLRLISVNTAKSGETSPANGGSDSSPRPRTRPGQDIEPIIDVARKRFAA